MTIKQSLAVLSLLLLLTNVQAETLFVTDQFKVMVRSGEGTSHKIIRMLSSGTPVELIRSNPDTGYSEVRLANSNIGYILTRQLMNSPSAREQLAEAKAKVSALTAEPGRLTTQLSDLQNQHKALTQEYSSLQREKRSIERELAVIKRTAANAVKIAEERNQLSDQVEGLEAQLSNLRLENQSLSKQSTQKWFMIGAGVTVTGILIGLILPHLRLRRRKDNWGSL